MNKRILAALAIVIIVIAAFGALFALGVFNPAPSAEARNIRIGVVGGLQKPEGQDILRAAQLAADEINAAGGVMVNEWHTRVKIDVVTVDTVDDTSGNAKGPVLKAITDDQVDLLIGGPSTGGTLASEAPAVQYRVPFIITGASLNAVTRRTDLNDTEGMTYMFHYCTTTTDYSKTVAHFFAESFKPALDAKYSYDTSRPLRLAILYRADGYGRGVKNDTVKIIADDGLPIEIVALREYSTTATTYQTDLTAVKDAKPDAVYIAGLIQDTAEIIREGVNSVKMNTLFMAVEVCEDPQFYSIMGSAGANQLLESKVATQWQGSTWYLPAVGTYVQNYQAKFGVIPGMLGADTYDAFYIAKNAIESAGTVNKTNVRDALLSTDMPQSLLIMENGKIQFSANYHEIMPKTFVEQLIWNSVDSTLKPTVIYPETLPGVSLLKQSDFVIPDGYQPGSP
jgi:branched-chain amino acid transport system substrate-binding protein